VEKGKKKREVLRSIKKERKRQLLRWRKAKKREHCG
jgi:hypothetical protein